MSSKFTSQFLLVRTPTHKSYGKRRNRNISLHIGQQTKSPRFNSPTNSPLLHRSLSVPPPTAHAFDDTRARIWHFDVVVTSVGVTSVLGGRISSRFADIFPSCFRNRDSGNLEKVHTGSLERFCPAHSTFTVSRDIMQLCSNEENQLPWSRIFFPHSYADDIIRRHFNLCPLLSPRTVICTAALFRCYFLKCSGLQLRVNNRSVAVVHWDLTVHPCAMSPAWLFVFSSLLFSSLLSRRRCCKFEYTGFHFDTHK